MNMKKNTIPYHLRVLLEDVFIGNLTLEIFMKVNKKKIFKFCPERVFHCLNMAFSDQTLYLDDKEIYENNIKACYELLDNEYIDLLIKEKIITGKYNYDEDGFLMLNIKKIDLLRFKILVKWVEEKKYINNYGLFSLNTLTGEAYFKDNRTIFKPATGYYNLFKEFITTKNKYLTFQEIVEIQQLNKSLIKAEDIKNYARAVIKHLKRKLSIKSGTGKLLIMYEKMGYSLQKGA